MKIGCLFSRKSWSVCFSFSLGAYRVRYRSQRDAPTNVLLMTYTRSFLLPPQKSNIKHIQKNSLIIIFSKEFKRWQSLFLLVLSLLWQLRVWLDNIGDVWLFSENMNWCWKQMRHLIQLPSTASKLFVFVRGAPKHCRTTILCDFQKIFFTKRKKSF